MRGRGFRSSSNLILDPGLDLSIDPPRDGVIPPVLLAWEIHTWWASTYALLVGGYATETDIDCAVSYLFIKGRDSEVSTWSTPDQTDPHTNSCVVDNSALWGIDVDLHWRWRIGAGLPSEWILIGEDAIYIPEEGDLPGEYP